MELGIIVSGGLALGWPQVGYVLLPGAWAATAERRGRPGIQVAAAFLAGLIAGPLVLALGPALTTRMLPLLVVAPLLLLGWLGPLAQPEDKQTKLTT